MSRDERASEAAFLKERWNLIQEGTDHKSIKRQNEIYINNKLHGRLEKSSNGFYIVSWATSPSHDVLLVNNTNIASSSVAVQDNVNIPCTHLCHIHLNPLLLKLHTID